MKLLMDLSEIENIIYVYILKRLFSTLRDMSQANYRIEYAIVREVLQNRASQTTGHNKSTVFAVRCIWRRAQATNPTNAAHLALGQF